MVLHIGGGELVPEERIVGVFDLDRCTCSARGRSFLDRAARAGEVVDGSGELPRSFVVCTHPYHTQVVYLSQLTPGALQGRLERGIL